MLNKCTPESLICTKCSGKLSIDFRNRIICCEFCGARQSLDSLIYGDNLTCIFDDSIVPLSSLSYYVDGCYIMETAKTEGDFRKAAQLLSMVPEIEGASQLCEHCMNEAEKHRCVREYSQAMELINSLEVKKLERAVYLFERLGNYKDSRKNLHICEEQLKVARDIAARQKAIDDEKRNRRNKVLKIFGGAVGLFILFKYFIGC